MNEQNTVDPYMNSTKHNAAILKALIDDVPQNWCDPLLTGDSSPLSRHAGKWGCPDIERLLNELCDRMRQTAKKLTLVDLRRPTKTERRYAKTLRKPRKASSVGRGTENHLAPPGIPQSVS